MLVRIVRYYQYPDIARQTPGGRLIWKDIQFTEDDVDSCDYLVILDHPSKPVKTWVPPSNIIHICQEPPSELSKYRQYGSSKSAVLVNQFPTGRNNILSHGALPWFVDKCYDELKAISIDTLAKFDKICWITSAKTGSKGHRMRMDFFDRIKNNPNVELFGRGIRPLEDKWTALIGCKYAIAFENYRNPYYWTEKISDCFLSFTIPIYFGCTQIGKYFPKGSYIQLDPTEPNADRTLNEILQSNFWEENVDALIEARNLVLDRYQLFPFLYNLIQDQEKARTVTERPEQVELEMAPQYFDNTPWWVYLEKSVRKFQRRLRT